jgi:hypothetical protein
LTAAAKVFTKEATTDDDVVEFFYKHGYNLRWLEISIWQYFQGFD